MLGSSCRKAPQPEYRTWRTYGGSPDQSKFFVQEQITRDNVDQLEVAWTYQTGDERSYQNNPVIVDDVMFIMARDNSLVALNATNGEEIWIHANLNGITRRGISYWESDDRSDRRILFTLNNTLQAIDATTGLSILDFGDNGLVDLRQGLGRDPGNLLSIASRTPGAIYGNLIIVGSTTGESYLSAPGHVRAYDVQSGLLQWIFHTIPQPGEYGYDTWPEDAYRYAGGVNCWGEITIDQANGIAFIPLGSPTYDFYGADRSGANLYGNCLVALDAATGKRRWHFQTVHHDLWDYDLVSAPQLITVRRDGQHIDAVVLATKQGFMFAFDRLTGEPVWPIEERPVPPSNVPGEQAWPTQPVPALPPFTRQTVHPEDISPLFLSDDEYLAWQERVRHAGKGLYTPPSTKETIGMPGAVGGANWGNTASHPDQGLVYVMSQDYPSFYKLEPSPPPLPEGWKERIATREAIMRGEIAYTTYCQLCHGKDLAGTSLGPSLLGIADRLTGPFLMQTVLYGTGRMPPTQNIQDNEISDILAFLHDRATTPGDTATTVHMSKGPVVASGGAPGELQLRTPGSYNRAGHSYPEGVEAPAQRYYTNYGLGYAYLLNPPWTSITCYDMNVGVIKWTRPLGEEPQAVAKGARHTGVPTGSQRNGMVITSNGLVFATVTNGRIYAYDADNGEILWTGRTAMGIASIPSMYQVDGHVFLVVNATTPLTTGWNIGTEAAAESQGEQGEYVVFTLPQNK